MSYCQQNTEILIGMSTTYVHNPHNFTFFFESNLNSSSSTGCFHFSNEHHAYILDYFFAPLVSRNPLLSSMKTLFLVKVRNSGGWESYFRYRCTLGSAMPTTYGN